MARTPMSGADERWGFTDAVEGAGSVKKLFILILLLLSGFAVWRKVQAQRADLDLWSEATAADDY